VTSLDELLVRPLPRVPTGEFPAPATSTDEGLPVISLEQLLARPPADLPAAPRAVAPGWLSAAPAQGDAEAAVAHKGDPNSPASQLAAILKETRKTLKNRQLYSHVADHGLDQLQALHGRLVRFLALVGEVSLRVEVSSFVWNDIEVFQDDGHDINFGYSLYRAGVRLLTFKPTIIWEEFLALWTLVADDLTYKGDEDLLTRLWRFGFEHVAWIAKIQLDDDEDTTGLLQVLDVALPDAVKNFAAGQLRAAHGAELAAMMAHFGAVSQAQPSAAALRLTSTTDDQHVERARVMAAVAMTLTDIAQLRSFPEADEYLAEAFEQLATVLIAEQNTAQLGAIAEHALEAAGQRAGPVQEAALKLGVAGFVKALAVPVHLRALRALLEEPSTTLPPRPFTALVRLLFTEGSPLLLSLLDANLSAELRTIVLRALSGINAEQAVHVARRIRSADEKLACELLNVIGALQVPRRAMLCEPALTNASRLVRRTALEVIGRSPGDGGAPTMLGRHLDRCADAEERLAIIAAIARFEGAEAERVLFARSQRDDIDPREQHAVWRGLLGAGTSSVLAQAEKVATLSTRGLLGSAKDESAKAALVEALGEQVDARSLRILTVIAQDESRASRALVKRANELLAITKARVGGAGGT
jgi:hypothetical protein